ncbi:adenylyl-sulfate kinase [Brevibacillus humidisoli]|uniref:adenylyl-sulfate kinase n=1 Tax=Brevibacillus humidisoli TaxID=2895522 RepID=UPI001E3DCB14|nr:adenylyl-sulfate kinase [Brevibacillus humidisoli]UFJ43263.1 adenylyl-sulfate kinase [Brevibacillus humidisoli]
MSKSTDICWHDSKVNKEDRRTLNGHKSCVLWFTGLSGSGKSTLATELEKELYQRRIRTYVLDGDNLRYGLNRDLGFSREERTENIRRIGELSKLFVDAGLITLCAIISPFRGDRDQVRCLFEPGEFIEIYVKCPLSECERRDPKGLYQKARAGQIQNFTGISAPYEVPDQPDMIIETDKQSVSQSVEQLLTYLREHNYIGT